MQYFLLKVTQYIYMCSFVSVKNIVKVNFVRMTPLVTVVLNLDGATPEHPACLWSYYFNGLSLSML